MNISIFGLGYVGCVSLGCLAQNGHKIIGVDLNPLKIDLINQGKPTVIEKYLDQIIKENRKNIKATNDYKNAVKNTEIAIICVGTPSTNEGHLNLDQIRKVAQQIGESLYTKNSFYTIFIRSTVPPGTNAEVAAIIEKYSNKKNNKYFAVVSNPEFLREGNAVYDFYHPPYTIIASESQKGIGIGKKLYKNIPAPIIETEVKEAEILKYINNAFHALKITFANEIGNICKKLNIDSHKVMDLFSKDTKLNISPAYLKPGFAYGGSCLPKDLKALTTLSHDFYLKTPVINAINESNKEQINYTIQIIESTERKKLGFVGITFKAGTDDLRFSPTLEVVEYFLGKGYIVKLFDSNVHLSKLTGTNKDYLDSKLPHISQLLSENLQQMLDDVELIIISTHDNEIEKLKMNPNKVILDLVRIKQFESYSNYIGIAW